MRNFVKRNGGFSLIELLLVIGFISGALVLAFVTYPKVQAQNRANVENQHITIMASGIKNLFSTAQNFGSINNTMLIAANVIPDDMTKEGAVISNTWGGGVVITTDIDSGSATNKKLRYQITYDGIPSVECTKIATGVSSNFLVALIGTTKIMDRIANANGVTQIDPGTVITACSAAASNTIKLIGN